jgi:hypothetical protein
LNTKSSRGDGADGRHDIRHNDTQHNDIQYIDTQHKEAHFRHSVKTTFSTSAFSIKVLFSTLSMTTLSLSILSIKGLFSTLSINDKQHILHECHYSDCRDLFIVMLNVVMQCVFMLSVIMLNVVTPAVGQCTILQNFFQSFSLLWRDKLARLNLASNSILA